MSSRGVGGLDRAGKQLRPISCNSHSFTVRWGLGSLLGWDYLVFRWRPELSPGRRGSRPATAHRRL